MSTVTDLPQELGRSRDAGRRRVRHLAEPGADRALCGARRGRDSAPSEADLCVVCGDMARSARWGQR